jgi:DeoR/GlpR family transcriptional regulator of sugar metabolism
MSISKRQEQILELLQANSFLTVSKLSKLLYTSPSSVRRDLTVLHNKCLIKRVHGGASVLNELNQAAPFNSRINRNIANKRKIASIAASLLKDGQIIMLDGSSTASFLIPHIAKKKDVTLFTNNMITAIKAINYGIKTHCLGGTSVNNSAVLSGPESYAAVSEIHPDLLFFSSHSIDDDGTISDPTQEENYLRSLMIANSKLTVFLCDSEKFNRRSTFSLTNLDKIDYAVFDIEYSNLKTKCKIL